MGTQPENTHGIQTQTQPNPYPKFGLGPGITLGYPKFGYPIPAIVRTAMLLLYIMLTRDLADEGGFVRSIAVPCVPSVTTFRVYGDAHT